MADLSARYATALFELSNEGGKLHEYLEQAEFLRDTLQSDDCRRIITHPRISTAEKFAFFGDVFPDINTDFRGFLHLAVAKNRENYIIPSLTALVEMIRSYQSLATAKVISAIELTDVQIAQLSAVLSKKLKKKVDVTVEVDPSVIGGLSIQVEGYYVDRTVKSLLKDMKETVKKGSGE